MITYLVIVSIILLFLGIIWQRRDTFNFLVKFILIGLSLWGWFLVLLKMGYVIKA